MNKVFTLKHGIWYNSIWNSIVFPQMVHSMLYLHNWLSYSHSCNLTICQVEKTPFFCTVLLSWFKWKKIYEVQFWPQSIPSGINKPFQAKTKSFNDGPWKNPPPLSPFSRNPSLSPLPSRPTPCPTALKNTGTNTHKSTKNSLKNNLVFQGTG